MYADFKDYSSNNGYDVAHNTQIIAEGADKNIVKSLIICTWQSVYKQPSTWFNQLDVIFMDEVHQGKADCIKGIFEKSTEVKHRFGVTGSLDKSAVNKMVLRGMIGEISKVKSTRDLIDEGHLSEIKIGCIILKYNKETKKLLKTADYKQEMAFLCQHEGRNRFIRKLALQQKGNTLVLFNYVESHGEPLYEQIKENATTQKVHFVAGKVEADDREEIRLLVQNSTDDNIICASVGTFSTGINLPRIHTIIFATPTKSVVRVMQSIGRGLRKSDDKAFLQLYDICDSINPSKSTPNFTLKHFVERLRIYTEEEHPYKLMEIQLEK
jgi:superfamily II DNA or RNA helicase